MRIVHNIDIKGPSTTKFAAYGMAGPTLMSLGTGAAAIGTVFDKEGLTGKYVVGLNAADKETIRLPLKAGGSAQGESFAAMTATVKGSEYDALSCKLDGIIAEMSGGFLRVSGTPSTILQIAAGYRPSIATSLSCIHVGAETCTTGWALLGTDGVVTVDSALTDASRVHIEGKWTVAP